MSGKFLEGKNIFITGAGTIGEGLLENVLKYNIKSVRIFDNNELKLHNIQHKYKGNSKVKILLGDIRDKYRLSIAMKGIDIVFHTAALKHVCFCEDNPIDAVKTNVVGTQNIIDICIEQNIEKLINISTDKSVNPINVMGATKLLAERIIFSASVYLGKSKTVFSTVRFGNVWNSSGSVVPIFKRFIDEKKDLTLTDKEMTRFIMTIDNAIELIFKAAEISIEDEIFILKMPSIRIIDLATAMIKKYKSDSKIKITGIQTSEKLHECLITEEESKLAYENDELIVIPRQENIKYFLDKGFKKMTLNNIISNDNSFLTVDEIIEMLE